MMKLKAAAVALAAVVSVAFAAATPVLAAPYCAPGQEPVYVFGFKALHDILGEQIGDPLECEHTEASTGDAHQQTSKGLSFYREITNTPTFTNGWDHWALTAQGLVYWTGSSIDPPGTKIPTSARQEFTGNGDYVLTVELSRGLALLTFTHDGSRNFIVWIRGTDEDLLVNTIGVYEGRRSFPSGGGSFLLDIQADGAWKVAVEEPRNQLPGPRPPYGGTGDDLTAFFHLDAGVHIAEFSHTGTRNFIVWLIDEQGSQVDLLVNTIGPYGGRRSFRISESGLYAYSVSADGQWAADVE